MVNKQKVMKTKHFRSELKVNNFRWKKNKYIPTTGKGIKEFFP